MALAKKKMEKKEKKIIDTVGLLADDIVDFTCRLVAEPSTLGCEATVVEVMKAELEHLSLAPQLVPIDPETMSRHPGFAPVPWEYKDKNNIVAVREADGTGGSSVLFNGHLDVVSAGPAHYWDTDPFLPTIRNGKIYGRGAGDMKSGVAAMTYAVHAVKKAGFGLKAPVTVEGVIEEECTGNGALACLHAGYDADAVLIPEPFGPTILTQQVGVLWFKVTVQGKPVHVLKAPAGINAIEKSCVLIEALRKLEAELNESEVPPAYQGLSHPLNFNIGIFRGGEWPSTVPADAKLHCRLSYFPGVAYETIRHRIVKNIEGAAKNDPWLRENPPKVEFYGFRSDGHSVPKDLPAFVSLNDCHRTLTGQDAEEYVSTCTTDLRAFQFFGKGQSTCYGPVGDNFHGTNEWVDIKSIVQVAKVYALFLARWCKLAE